MFKSYHISVIKSYGGFYMNRDENNNEEEEYEDVFKPMQCPYMKNNMKCPCQSNYGMTSPNMMDPSMMQPQMMDPSMMQPQMMNPYMMNPWMCGESPSMKQYGSKSLKQWGSKNMKQWGSNSMEHWAHEHGHDHGHNHGHNHGSRSIDSDVEEEDISDYAPDDFRYSNMRPRRRPMPIPYMRPPYYHYHHRPYYPRPYYSRPYYKPMRGEEIFDEFDGE